MKRERDGGKHAGDQQARERSGDGNVELLPRGPRFPCDLRNASEHEQDDPARLQPPREGQRRVRELVKDDEDVEEKRDPEPRQRAGEPRRGTVVGKEEGQDDEHDRPGRVNPELEPPDAEKDERAGGKDAGDDAGAHGPPMVPAIMFAVTGLETLAPPALKEWALVCHLLREGRQAILLRKGGIDEKGFWVEASRFFLFPTYLHQHRDKVREEHRAGFDRLFASQPDDGLLRMDCFARVLETVTVSRPENLPALRDLHPYTDEQIAMRVEFRPRKPLVILVVQASPLILPSTSEMRPEYAGCLSWVNPGLPIPALGPPARDEPALTALAERVRAEVD